MQKLSTQKAKDTKCLGCAWMFVVLCLCVLVVFVFVVFNCLFFQTLSPIYFKSIGFRVYCWKQMLQSTVHSGVD